MFLTLMECLATKLSFKFEKIQSQVRVLNLKKKLVSMNTTQRSHWCKFLNSCYFSWLFWSFKMRVFVNSKEFNFIFLLKVSRKRFSTIKSHCSTFEHGWETLRVTLDRSTQSSKSKICQTENQCGLKLLLQLVLMRKCHKWVFTLKKSFFLSWVSSFQSFEVVAIDGDTGINTKICYKLGFEPMKDCKFMNEF